MPILASRSPIPTAIDPRLERMLRRSVMLGLCVVLLLPAARGSSVWLGWLPLWLLGMPLSAWWASHRFALPRWPRLAALPRRRRGQQARRRAPAARRMVPQLRAA
jgi:hypothetical protein